MATTTLQELEGALERLDRIAAGALGPDIVRALAEIRAALMDLRAAVAVDAAGDPLPSEMRAESVVV